MPRGDSRKLILVVIDGLTPDVFEDAVETGSAPALAARLRRRGGERYAGLRILARD